MDRDRQNRVIQAVRDTAVQCGAIKAIVFGSFARGSATRRSDVDVVFVEDTAERFIERLDRYMKGIYERVGIPADVFVYTPDEFARMADQPFLKRVLREGIVAYEH
jgi:predicted nucleotidyltransferase